MRVHVLSIGSLWFVVLSVGSCGCHVHPIKRAFPHPCTVLPLRSLESTILTATLQCTMPLCAWLRYVEGVPCAVKGHCTAMHVWAFYWLLVGSSRSPIIMRNVIFGHSFIITLGQCITLLRMPSPVSPSSPARSSNMLIVHCSK